MTPLHTSIYKISITTGSGFSQFKEISKAIEFLTKHCILCDIILASSKTLKTKCGAEITFADSKMCLAFYRIIRTGRR